MKRTVIICLTVMCLANFPLVAQDNSQDIPTPTPAYVGGFFKNYAFALKANTLGLGVDFMTALHPNIKLRLGCNYAGFINLKINKEFEGTSIDGEKRDVPVHIDKINLDFLNGNLLIDIFPWRKAGFHITAGLYIGKTYLPANGTASEPFALEDYVIRPDANGNFKATLQLGNIFKPYFGIGFGRTIPKSRVGFKFDIGIIYQGPYDITSDNMDGKYLFGETTKFVDEEGVPKILTEIWPMISFSLICRIK